MFLFGWRNGVWDVGLTMCLYHQVDCKVYRGSLIQQLLDVVALFCAMNRLWSTLGFTSLFSAAVSLGNR